MTTSSQTRNWNLKRIDNGGGTQIVTLGRDPQGRFAGVTGLPDDGAVFVAVSRRGHWRRWDDARLDNGDAVCRGCGYHDSWQRIDDRRVECPHPASETELRDALTGGAR